MEVVQRERIAIFRGQSNHGRSDGLLAATVLQDVVSVMFASRKFRDAIKRTSHAGRGAMRWSDSDWLPARRARLKTPPLCLQLGSPR